MIGENVRRWSFCGSTSPGFARSFRRSLCAALALVAAACGGGNRVSGLSSLRPACAVGQTWDGSRCKAFGGAAPLVEQAHELLRDGEFERAEAVIERANQLGPHAYDTHVRIYEELGKAYAFQDREAEAIAAFTKLLALSPGHLISYWIKNQVTFKFEEARKRVDRLPRTEIDVGWPDDLDTRRPVPIDVEVVADPMKLLSRAVLEIGRGGERRAIDVELAPRGERTRVVVPAVGSEAPETLELRLVGFDAAGNEVALWGVNERRALRLGYTPPTPWYRKWTIMGPIVGAGVAAIAGTIYLIARPEPGVDLLFFP
jgi:tetratricopeptide (TPR) repeat protein